MGRVWAKENMDRQGPEALVEIRQAFEILETTLLVDGWEEVDLGTEGPR